MADDYMWWRYRWPDWCSRQPGAMLLSGAPFNDSYSAVVCCLSAIATRRDTAPHRMVSQEQMTVSEYCRTEIRQLRSENEVKLPLGLMELNYAIQERDSGARRRKSQKRSGSNEVGSRQQSFASERGETGAGVNHPKLSFPKSHSLMSCV